MKEKSIKKNFIMNAILTMSGFIFPIITFPYIAHVLGPEGTGPVKFATSVVAYFAMFAQLGIPTYGIRVCAKVRDDKKELSKTVHELLLINVIMSVIIYVLFFASLFLIPRLQKDKLLMIIISSTIFFNAIGIEYLYKALEQYTYITIRSIIFKFIAIISMFLLVKSVDDYVIYGAITIFAASASNVLNFFHSKKLIEYKWYGGYNFRRHYKAIMVFFAMSCATTVYLNLDGIMLGFMLTDTDVGYYDAAVKIKTILVSIVTSLGTVLLPRASYYIENKQMDEFRRITEKALNFVVIFATPLMMYFMLFAKEGILFLSGVKFIPSILAMQIIMPTLLFIGLTNIMGIQILVPLGKEKIVLYSEIAGAIVDLILNIIFIPSMKSAGAALGTVAAEFVVFVVQYLFLRKMTENVDIKNAFGQISFWKVGLATLSALAASFWVKLLDLSGIFKKIEVQNFILIAISGTVFFVVYLAVMLVTKDALTTEVVGSILKKVKKR